MNARPVIQVARLRPESRKSRLVRMKRLSATPIPSTNTKYRPMTSVVDRKQLHAASPGRLSDSRTCAFLH